LVYKKDIRKCLVFYANETIEIIKNIGKEKMETERELKTRNEEYLI